MERVRKNITHSIDLATQDLYPASYWMRQGANRTSSRDCFEKTYSYAEQKEWRVCLFRNQKDDKPYILDVGDLSDIIDIIDVKQLREYLLQRYNPCIDMDVEPQLGPFIGHVGRREFKEKLYQYDEGMGRMMLVIG